MFSRVLLRSSAFASRTAVARPCVAVQARNLNIHEYQSQALMRKFNVSVPDGDVADSVEEAEAVARRIGSYTSIILHCNGNS